MELEQLSVVPSFTSEFLLQFPYAPLVQIKSFTAGRSGEDCICLGFLNVGFFCFLWDGYFAAGITQHHRAGLGLKSFFQPKQFCDCADKHWLGWFGKFRLEYFSSGHQTQLFSLWEWSVPDTISVQSVRFQAPCFLHHFIELCHYLSPFFTDFPSTHELCVATSAFCWHQRWLMVKLQTSYISHQPE